jgi:hypothetical protein
MRVICYSLAVNYLFMTNQGSNEHPELVVQPFEANTELNDYEVGPLLLGVPRHHISLFPLLTHFVSLLFSFSIFAFSSHLFCYFYLSQIPWALRDLIANEGVAQFFANDIASLRNAFPNWHPKTAILKDIKRKLQPIQRLNTNPSMGSSPSKL